MASRGSAPEGKGVVAYVGYRPPFRFDLTCAFLGTRAIEGIEVVEAGTYRRIVRHIVEDGTELIGAIEVADEPERSRLRVSPSPALADVADDMTALARRIFDTDADPAAIEAGLSDFYARTPAACRIPGIRVPGCADAFEMTVRAILGQQITVKAANTLAGRVAAAFGTPVDTGDPALATAFPSPQALCGDDAEARLGELGVIRSRARAICAIARGLVSGELSFDLSADSPELRERLLAVPGIGQWTLNYLLMRIFKDPDAFPAADYGVKLGFPGMTPRQIEALSEAWRPWRAYATLSLWSTPHEAFADTNAARAKTSAGAQAKPRKKSTQKKPVTTRPKTSATSKEKPMHTLCTYASPLGDITLSAKDGKLAGVYFAGQKYDLRGVEPDAPTDPSLPIFDETRSWLNAYFEGRDPGAIPPVTLEGSDSQNAVWQLLAEIPYGETTTYGDLAKRVGEQRCAASSARAVGGAVGHNPISIILPCHRVVGATGSLTGYAGGIERKIALLKLEGVDMSRFTIPTSGTAL